MKSEHLREFLIESNKIEGIDGTDSKEMEAAYYFIKQGSISVNDLEALVDTFQPGAKLRDKPGMNVNIGYNNANGIRVVKFRPMDGGPYVTEELRAILGGAMKGAHPRRIHHEFQLLHPFQDGNGHSGRMLWLWQMVNQGHDYRPEWGFLHTFYFQSLEHGR